MSTEKVLLLGASHSKGVAAKTNEPYEMMEAFVTKSLKSVDRPNRKVTAFGFEMEKLSLTGDAFVQVSKLELPKEVTVVIDAVKNENGYRNDTITAIR